MKRIVGNALNAKTGVFIHGCNAQGVMGSGVAKTIKDKFPSAFNAYIEQHKNGGLKLGSYTIVEVRKDFWIANAITQKFYGREKSKVYIDYRAIEKAFSDVGAFAKENNLPLLFPLIGCGLGGGDWARVSNIIEDAVPKTVEKILYTLDNSPLCTDDKKKPVFLKY